jgi:hypothetical protein
MFLADHAMQHALEQVQTAFPFLTQWAYTNASDDERSLDGFSLWGQWVLQPEACTARHCSITFATHAEHWSGHLPIGQHSYFWTSADGEGMPTSWIPRRVPPSRKPSSCCKPREHALATRCLWHAWGRWRRP